MDGCVFCQITAGAIPAALLYQDEWVTAFEDLHPIAPVHFLVVPNRHIRSVNEVEGDDEGLLGRLVTVAKRLASQKGVQENGYRLVINTGPDAGQSVFHLHLHVIGGRKMPFRFEDSTPNPVNGQGTCNLQLIDAGQALNLPQEFSMKQTLGLILVLATAGLLAACVRPGPTTEPWMLPPVQSGQTAQPTPFQPVLTFLPPTRQPGTPEQSPTPDPPRILPTMRPNDETYIVQPLDTLGTIAQRYGVDLNTLIAANQIQNANMLEVGQSLIIPAPDPQSVGSDFKILPDSELVYGPASALFNIDVFIQTQGGYLAKYEEKVDDQLTGSAAIIARIAYEYSVNPRLLLAALEYQSGWVTNPNIDPNQDDFPMGYPDGNRPGLYRQLAWAANNLNHGYYSWRVNSMSSVVLPDGSVVPLSASINAGTAGVQYFMSRLYNRGGWDKAVGENGLYATYKKFFGFPYDLAVEPLIPAGLTQPTMQLPLEPGESWSFTGGPHAGWGDGSGWAAIDFAPPGEGLGCVQSNAWVTAVADGLIIRSGNGSVVLDLDGDGLEQTGWTVLYLHIETRDRVPAGTQVKAGDRIGHPSCEGGVSNGTHVHMARRYNGEWIPADGALPYNLEGWISQGAGVEYNGTLTKDGQVVEAWDRKVDANQISR